MRRILIDRARAKGRQKRGGDWDRTNLSVAGIATEDPDELVLAIHEALEKLSTEDPVKADIVKLRYFVGMSHAEIAEALNLGESTVRRHWNFARSWLYAELQASS